MSEAKTVFVNMKKYGISGRVVVVDGNPVAEVSTSGGAFRRANTSQTAALFRNAIAVALLQEGDQVIAWKGDRLVRGEYVRPAFGEHLINIGYGEDLVNCVLPLAIAVHDGLWSFKPGMPVAAYIDDEWVEATWLSYERGEHIVRLAHGQRNSRVVHLLDDATEMGLVAA